MEYKRLYICRIIFLGTCWTSVFHSCHRKKPNQNSFSSRKKREWDGSTSQPCCKLAFSENKLTRTNEQKRSMKACSIREFWCGCENSSNKSKLFETLLLLILTRHHQNSFLCQIYSGYKKTTIMFGRHQTGASVASL